MSEIRSISEGTFVIGDTNGLTFEAGPGISVSQPSEGTVRIANDETVLFENNAGATEATLSESFANFDRIRIYFLPYSNNPVCQEIFYNSNQTYNNMSFMYGFYEGQQWRGFKCTFNVGMTLLKILSSYYYEGYANGVDVTYTAKIYKVVGINRISGGNA